LLKLICLAFLLAAATDARAYSDSFKLTVSEDGRHGEPADRVFTVRGGAAATFYVILTNTSSSAQLFYGQVANSGYSSIVFELSDEAGNSNMIRRKRDLGSSGAVASTYIQPGESKVFEIDLNENEWENLFNLYRKGARRVRARAIYENDYKKICSEYYDVILTDAAGEKSLAIHEKVNGSGSIAGM
jgi:hypothetical protein